MGGTGQPLADSKAASRVGVQLPYLPHFCFPSTSIFVKCSFPSTSILTEFSAHCISGCKLDSHYYFLGEINMATWVLLPCSQLGVGLGGLAISTQSAKISCHQAQTEYLTKSEVELAG